MVKQSDKRLITKLVFACVAMFGFGFALVPLYDVFCEVTGINGKTSNQAAVYQANQIDTSRVVTVEFITNVKPGTSWEITPEINKIQVHPGELMQVSFIAKSHAQQTTYAQAVPSVSPGVAAIYLNKTECFCFQRQQLQAGAQAEMPLIFFIDPQLPDDIETLTLAYTLFNIEQAGASVGGANYE